MAMTDNDQATKNNSDDDNDKYEIVKTAITNKFIFI